MTHELTQSDLKDPVPPSEEILHWAVLLGLTAQRLRAPELQKSDGSHIAF